MECEGFSRRHDLPWDKPRVRREDSQSFFNDGSKIRQVLGLLVVDLVDGLEVRSDFIGKVVVRPFVAHQMPEDSQERGRCGIRACNKQNNGFAKHLLVRKRLASSSLGSAEEVVEDVFPARWVLPLPDHGSYGSLGNVSICDATKLGSAFRSYICWIVSR